MSDILFPASLNQELFARFNQTHTQIGVLVDENTAHHCYPHIQGFLKPHTLVQVASGEEHKTLDTCGQIWEALTKAGFDRHALLINLGGGVIGDMGGFCAATYKRGIDFVQIPTTLLAQVDASAGGKLGIDFMGFKNHIGVFRNPLAVVVWQGFLQTLPPLELRSGFAEAVKHGLIADAAHWETLSAKPLAEQDWQVLIPHSVGIKQQVTAQDPTEKGLRKILNFGHTVGHAVESFFLETGPRLLHGEAVAIGMICEAYLSHITAGLDAVALKRITSYLLAVFGKQALAGVPFDALFERMAHDKKNQGGKVQFALLEAIGRCGYGYEIEKVEVEDSFRFYKQLAGQ